MVYSPWGCRVRRNWVTNTHTHTHTHMSVVLVVKNLSVNAGDIRNSGFILGSRRSPGGGHGDQLQYSCLENPMDRGTCWATVYRVTRSWTGLKCAQTTYIYNKHSKDIQIAWWITVIWKWSEVAQLCPTLCDSMNCRLPGSSIHEIFQARVLEWVASSFSNVHKQPIFITNILRISRLLDGLQWYKYIQFWVDQFE